MKMRNSILLMSYLSLSSIYYLFGDGVRYLIFFVVLILSLYIGIGVKGDKIFFKVPANMFWIMSVIFAVSVFVQIVNSNLTPFVIFYLSTPLVSYFIFRKRFNSKILSIPYYCFSMYVLVYFLMHHNLLGVMGMVSENYVSVVLIMNIAVIYTVKFQQEENITVFPAVLALFISILAIGRAGILITLTILLLVLWLRWKDQNLSKKVLYAFLFLLPFILSIILKWGFIVDTFNQIEVFEKFTKSGVDSPARDIIKRTYLSNMDWRTLLTGYDYRENFWFQHYGLNPHNSFIKLHHYSGVAFFIIMPILIVGLIRLIKKNILLAGLLFVVLLRSWTDSILFLSLFDIVPIVLLLHAFYDKKRISKIA